MTLQFKKAERTAVKIKLAISGPSGSGKTKGAIALGKGLGAKVAVLDTENGSASTYAEMGFDVIELGPPFTSARFIEVIDAAIEAGYDVLIIDSLSHQWAGDGGILSRKEEMDKRPGSNSYTNWATFTKEHTAFVSRVLHAPIHIIATLRSKQDYVLETNERGKQTPRKVGLAPVQRDGLEYEFSTMFELQMDHRASVSKDRTGLFADELVDLCDKRTAVRIKGWLDSAAPAKPTVETSNGKAKAGMASEEQIERLTTLLADERIDEGTRMQMEARIRKGITADKAEEYIARIDHHLATQDYEREQLDTDNGELGLTGGRQVAKTGIPD
ncbi:MAG TPA: AAA family ATPase [Gemmatimonadaceae bacterium]|nr:AAA family ATPase [Gemmatimonadaceae bacterium]